MHYSKEVAAELNHSYIGTEHILIGLLREKEGLACQVLEDHDVTEEKVLHMVSQLIQGSQTIVAEPEEYTPRSRRILEIANREAMRFRASAIGTEHLLIAILRETDCVAAQLLYSLGVQAQKVYQDIVLGIGMDARAAKADMPSAKSKRFGNDLAAVFGAGGEVGIDAVGMRHIGIQQGVEARFHRGAQRFHALNALCGGLCLGGTGLFHILKVGRLAAVVKAAQCGVVKHRVGLVDFNVLQAETGGLDGHERIIQLDGGIAAAALHVVCPATGSFGHAGKLFEPFLVLFDKFHVYFSFALAQLSLRETVRL